MTPFSQDIPRLPAQGAPPCRRCGACCQAGGPALHREDMPLLRAGLLPRARLLTLRAGETARDNVSGGLAPLPRELVKLAAREQGHACVFHEAREGRCAIHAHRPAECRILSCEAPEALRSYYSQGRLTRADIVIQESALGELMRFHDEAFPAARVMALARQAAMGSPEALEALGELAQAEGRFRRAFLERSGAEPAELDFLFGRAAPRLCAPFGLAITG